MYGQASEVSIKASDSNSLSRQLNIVVRDNGIVFFERVLDKIAKSICRTEQVRIAQVDTPDALAKLRASRLRMYQQRDGYFDRLTRSDGSDDLDQRSYLFAAYVGGAIIGSIRLTPAPFEADSYLEPQRIRRFLGEHEINRYLEFSRLVVDSDCAIRGLSRALIVYSGLLTSLSTPYDRYLAIVRPEIKNKVFHFQLESDALSFSIAERGEHEYHLVKGSFAADFYDILSGSIDVIRAGLEAGKVADDKTFCSF